MRRALLLMALTSFSAIAGISSTSKEAAILERAKEHRLMFRAGKYDVVNAFVAGLEQGAREYPQNGQIWNALGAAYLSRLTASAGGSASPAERMAYLERARDAYAHALRIDQNDAEARGGHGMAITLLGSFKRDAAAITAGLHEMNEAVRIDPANTPARLSRAFTTVNLPSSIRDPSAVIADLTYLIEQVPGSRAEDVLRLLLGDFYAEEGRRDAARREYEWIGAASRFAADEATSRLQQLDRGEGVPAEAIARVRSRLGSQCTMCHAEGTDG